MGMYDEITFYGKKPDGYTGAHFQTKDLSCEIDQYEITENGRLIKTHSCKNGNGIEKIEPQDMNFHGVLNFYNLTPEKVWHEYNAKFTDGNLVSIEVVK